MLLKMNDTKRAIFDSALKEFSLNGYTSATMDDIATNAGVAKGTLYYHFKSKEEIFNFIITEGMNLITQKTVSETERVGDVLSKLRAVCRVQLELVFENKDFLKVVMSQLWGQELRNLELREIIKNYIETLESYLLQAMKEGLIKKGDPNFMAFAFFGTLCSAAVYELMNNDVKNVELVIDQLMDYVLMGIKR